MAISTVGIVGSGIMGSGLAEVVARAHKFEVNGSPECAEIMRLAAAYAWPDVVTVADDSAPLSLAVC